MSQKQNKEHSDENPDHLLIPESDLPLSFIDRLLPNPEGQPRNSSAANALLTMVDSLTDYILQMVSAEANNRNRQLNPQDAQRAAGRNGVPQRYFPGSAFSLFDKMLGSRRKG
ncbi:huntingtin-interacting protein M [Hipposideros larvatus]